MVTPAEVPLDRGRLYRGEILVFRRLPAMAALVARARALACEAFAPHAPPEAQGSFDRAEFLARAAALRAGATITTEVVAHYNHWQSYRPQGCDSAIAG